MVDSDSNGNCFFFSFCGDGIESDCSEDEEIEPVQEQRFNDQLFDFLSKNILRTEVIKADFVRVKKNTSVTNISDIVQVNLKLSLSTT